MEKTKIPHVMRIMKRKSKGKGKHKEMQILFLLFLDEKKQKSHT
jgi:hypothetical protein